METAAAGGQSDPEGYCAQLLKVPEQEQALSNDDPMNDSGLLPTPENGTPLPEQTTEPTPQMPGPPDEEPDDDMMNMSEDSFKGLTPAIDNKVALDIKREGYNDYLMLRSAFANCDLAKHPLRIAVMDKPTKQVAVFEGYCCTALDAAYSWATGEYELLKACFDEKRDVDLAALTDITGTFNEGEYIVGAIGTASSRLAGIGRAAQRIMGRGGQAATGAGGQVVNRAQDVLMVFQRMGIQATDRVTVMARGVQGGSQQFAGAAQQVAMQIQQFAARTGGVIMDRIQKASGAVGPASQAVPSGAGAGGGFTEPSDNKEGQMTTPQVDEKDKVIKEQADRINALEARLNRSEYMEHTKELSLVQGTPEELADKLVTLRNAAGEEAATEQLRSWKAEQENSEVSQFGESILDAVGSPNADSFEGHVSKYMEDHPDASRREAFIAVGKAHPELRDREG